MVEEKSVTGGFLPSYITTHFNTAVMERFDQGLANGTSPTTPISGLASNVLLATEVICYLLRDTGLVQRQAVFAPRFSMVDFLEQNMVIGDVTTD